MKIDALKGMMPNPLQNEETKKAKPGEFSNVLGDFIGTVNQTQLQADEITQDFVNGGNVELHEVMIAGEKAKTSMDLLMEIRNKAVDMYKELTRMQ